MSFSTELLEFDNLKRLLAGYAGSAGGRARVEALEPCSDRISARAAHSAASRSRGSYPVELQPDPRCGDAATDSPYRRRLVRWAATARAFPCAFPGGRVPGGAPSGRRALPAAGKSCEEDRRFAGSGPPFRE